MRRFAKQLLDLLATLLVWPTVLLYRLSCLFREPYRALAGWAQLYSLIPGSAGEYVRRAFYRGTLAGFGSDVTISFGTIIAAPTTRIGDRVYIGVNCTLEDVVVEEDALIGSHVSIISGTRHHGIDRLDIPIRDQHGPIERITVGRDSWVGDRCVIAANIGRHCVIGAGAVVIRPVPDYAVAVGVPARVVRLRSQGEALQPPRPAIEDAV